MAETSYSGTTAPTYGAQIIVADGSGGIKTNSTGKKVTVVNLDTTNAIVGFIF